MSHPQLPVIHSLALAVIAASRAPLLLLDEELAVLAASDSFCEAFDADAASVVGRRLRDLGVGEWNAPQLGVLLRATAAGAPEVEAYEMDLLVPGAEPRHLVLNATRLDQNDGAVRLLLTASDVTAARLAARIKDDLLREKAILLQEVQHRVANSLQIIASVLMQNARKVQSEEMRGHLREAHNRVMSVAAVQRQLAASTLGDVALRDYLRDLCESLGASMIHDHDQLSLIVRADDSKVDADVSVSLGLIVTELVINALKHAFPEHRSGLIAVDYEATGEDWALSVTDDGVGMPTDAASATPGLGTSIVEALSRQLNARVEVSDGAPGTKVAVIHDATS